MVEKSYSQVGARPPIDVDPIATIARASALRQSRAQAVAPDLDFGPELVEPTRPLAPKGMASVVDNALGSVKLPTLLDLANALETMSHHIDLVGDIDPGMPQLVKAVLEDEREKVTRYLDVRNL